MGHFIEKCKLCGAVIAQCRCPSKDKAVRYGICKECKAKEAKKCSCKDDCEDCCGDS